MKKLISLGNNCEVSFQIEKYQGDIDSSLFSWAFTLNDEKFLCALENIDDIFTHGVHFHMPSDDMFYDEEYDITFHGRTPKDRMFDHEGKIKDQAAYDETLAELQSRLNHLKEKMKQDFRSDDEKLYLRKVEIWPEADGTFRYERVIDFLQRLNLLLERKSPNGSYKLVAVVEKRHLTSALQALQTDKLLLRTVDYFAPFYDTKNGADYESWEKIFLSL